MKKLLYIVLTGFLVFLTLGASCEERLMEIPVVGFIDHTFSILEDGSSYNESDTFDFSAEIEKLRQENTFDSIKAVIVESITFTIKDNNSGAGTTITGTAKVASPTNAPLVTLASMSGLDLAAVQDTPQYLTLETAGVDEINEAIDILTGNGLLSFSVEGTSTSSTLDFDIYVKITITIIGMVKTEVPVI